jgi:phosphomannomutase
LGRAIGTFAIRHNVRKMTLGRNCHLSSETYQDAVSKGILATGVAINPSAAIIGEVKCSQMLYDDIAKNGGRAIMWKAGHSLI